MTNKEIFIETANRIGERLVKTALWDCDKCTWVIRTYDMNRPKDKVSITQTAEGTIYQGTAGIALFLCELFKKTRNKKFINIAEGALKFSLAEFYNLPQNSNSFYSGKTGIAYAIAKFGRFSDKEEYINKADNILKSLVEKEETDYETDAIGGSAGAIPILLSGVFKTEDALQLATNLAEHIINIAHKEPVGWSWSGGNANYRNLCGLAHGASGYGHALIEVYNATGHSKYFYAAEQAFLYERQFISIEKKNWPDFRYNDLFEYIFNGEIDLLKTVLSEGALPKYELNYMNSWCHGSPGIGLTRLRAFEITNQKLYKKEAEIAVEGTKNSLEMNQRMIGNFSLCHGIFGNCETLLYGSQVLKKNELLNTSEEIAVAGCKKYELQNKAWPSGTLGADPDPSLMLGDAGIGYFLLRLYDKSVRSVLLPCSEIKKEFKEVQDDSYLSLRNEYVNSYFGKTLAALGKTKVNLPLSQFNINSYFENDTSEIKTIQKTIESIVKTISSKDLRIVKEIFVSENLRYKRTLELSDYTEEFLFALEKGDIPDLKSDQILLKLAASVEVLECKYDSEKWLNNNKGKLIKDYEKENYLLLYRHKNKIQQKNINYLTYLLFSKLKTSLTLDELINKTLSFLQINNDSEKSNLTDIIIRQLTEAINANLIIAQNEIIPPKAKVEK